MTGSVHISPDQVGFLFDLDGVLVDTARFHFQAWRRLAQELGTDFTHEQNEQLKGASRRGSIERILEWGDLTLSEEEIERYMALKNDWYLELVKTLTPTDVLPGAKEFLEESRSQGVRTALGSASKNAKLILEQIEIDHLLDAVVDGSMVTHSKPHPEVFLKGAEALQKRPEHCVVFEDAQAGVKAAKAGGMRSVGIGDNSVLGDADVVRPSLAEISVHEAIQLL